MNLCERLLSLIPFALLAGCSTAGDPVAATVTVNATVTETVSVTETATATVTQTVTATPDTPTATGDTVPSADAGGPSEPGSQEGPPAFAQEQPLGDDLYLLGSGFSPHPVLDDVNIWGAALRYDGSEVVEVEGVAALLDQDGNVVYDSTFGFYIVRPGQTFFVGSNFTDTFGGVDMSVEAWTIDPFSPSVLEGEVTFDSAISGEGDDPRLVVTVENGTAFEISDGAEFCSVYRDSAGTVLGGACHSTTGPIAPGASRQVRIHSSFPGETEWVDSSMAYDKFSFDMP